MNQRGAHNPFGGASMSVDKRLGNSFPIVEAVYRQLQHIKYLAENLNELRPKDIELQENVANKTLDWRYIEKDGTKGPWQVLLPLIDITGQSPEMRVSADAKIQWKYTNEPDSAWRNIFDLSGYLDQISKNTQDIVTIKQTTAEQFAKVANLVESIDGLASLTANNKLVYVQSYRAGSNRGGGMFVPSTDPTLVLDNGLVFPGSNCKWVRLHDGFVTPEDFGAYGDNEHFDEDFIQAALGSGVKVVLQPHTYRCRKQIVAGGQTVSITGVAGSVISFTEGTTAGLKFNFTDTLQYLHVDSITIMTSLSGIGIGLQATWPSVVSSTFKSATIRNVTVTSPGVNPGYFSTGIKLTQGWLAEVSNCTIRGQNGTLLMEAGIHFDDRTTDATVTGCHVFFAKDGYRVTGFSEGVNVTQSYAVYVTNGVNGDVGQNAPSLYVLGCHLNVFNVGVNIDNRVQAHIADCVFYKFDQSTEDWVGVQAHNGSKAIHVVNNFFYGSGAGGTSTGVVVASDSVYVSGNQFERCDTADIHVLASGTNPIVVHNRRVDGAAIIIKAEASSGHYDNNTPNTDGYAVLAQDFATPSVGGFNSGGHFLTNSTVATAITDFLDGEIGDQITIWANDTLTTLTSGAKLSLKGGQSVTLPASGCITLHKNNSASWFEMSRNF